MIPYFSDNEGDRSETEFVTIAHFFMSSPKIASSVHENYNICLLTCLDVYVNFIKNLYLFYYIPHRT